MNSGKHIFEYSFSELHRLAAFDTAKEISMQPKLWKSIWENIINQKKYLNAFFKKIDESGDLQVVLTGAGSSAYIGEVLQMSFFQSFKREVHAIATTDLVTHFESLTDCSKPLLLISFARSGNSPESKATIEIAEKFCVSVYHLIITCNEFGELAKIAKERLGERGYVVCLPPEAEDQGLAMTGSFSGMTLAAYLVANIKRISELQAAVEAMCRYGKEIINQYAMLLKKVTDRDFERVFFLGSGPLEGIARESHLKVQELTDGVVVGKFDSFLGFRHGPRAVLSDKTMLIYLFSNNPYVNKYEKDLAESVYNVNTSTYKIGIAESEEFMGKVDLSISLPSGNPRIPEDLWAIVCILLAQMLGLFKSLQLGLKPDNPSVDGSISRVVKGVSIHPYPMAKISP